MAKKKRGLPRYRTYDFADTAKDPIIDKMRAVVDASNKRFSQINEESNVAAATLWNWFYGKTRRPQFATLNAVAIACNHELTLAPSVGHNQPQPVRQKRRPRRTYNRRHTASSVSSIRGFPVG